MTRKEYTLYCSVSVGVRGAVPSLRKMEATETRGYAGCWWLRSYLLQLPFEIAGSA